MLLSSTAHDESPAESAREARSVLVVLAVFVGAIVGLGMRTPRAASAPEPGVPLSWLAAGDSYSSGEGLPHAAGPCAQGAENGDSQEWAAVAHEALLKAIPSFARPVLVACTGAKIDQLIDSNDKAGHPEWDPSMGRFDLVTFTFGGDNVNFRPVMEQCLVSLA